MRAELQNWGMGRTPERPGPTRPLLSVPAGRLIATFIPGAASSGPVRTSRPDPGQVEPQRPGLSLVQFTEQLRGKRRQQLGFKWQMR